MSSMQMLEYKKHAHTLYMCIHIVCKLVTLRFFNNLSLFLDLFNLKACNKICVPYRVYVCVLWAPSRFGFKNFLIIFKHLNMQV